MKKKLFFVLMICVLAAIVAVSFTGCKGDKLPSVRNLNVTDDGYLSWGAVEGADGYVIYFNDNEADRFYLTNTYISIDEPEIKSVLKSGQKNNVYIRAVTLDSKKLPAKTSDRSKIIFNYSRKLATPNKIKMSKERFSWRGVTDAEDYKAYVRRSGETTGTLYDMTWVTGTASVTGTINDLADGNMYYVSIVATAEGYESSDPSDEVPYDRTATNVSDLTYTAYAGTASATMGVDFEDAALMVATVTAAEGAEFRVSDSTGKAYTVSTATAANAGDYVLTLNTNSGNVTVSAIASYYIYVNGDAGTKLAFNAATGVYTVNVTLKDGDNYVVKNGAGELVTTYTDDSANQGSSVTAGSYAIRVDKDAKVSVSKGASADTGESKPVSRDGQWAVTFDYNYEGAPAALVEYATDGRPVPTPAEPLRAGYKFEGWFADSYCLIEAAFGKKQSNFAITCPTTLYAKWTVDSTAVVEHTTHEDTNGDGKCDVCGKTIATVCTDHVDANGDGKCDVCGATVTTNKCTKHIDRNGDKKCDNCGALIESSVTVDTKGTIYFDVSAEDVAWFTADNAVLNMHVWYADGTNNGFPGPKMTYNSVLGYYEAEYYTNRVVKGVLFTRNNPTLNPQEGEQTEWNRVELTDFTFDANRPVYKLLSYYKNEETGYTTSTGAWIKVGEQINVKGDGKLYVDFRDISWFTDAGADVRAYIWYTDGTDNGAYPGKAVTYTTDASSKRYSAYVDYFTDKTVAGVIFTRNDPATGTEWNKIELQGEGFIFNPALPAYRVTALGAIFEGYWESEADALASPTDYGSIEDEDGDKTAYFYLDMSAVTWFGDNDPVVKARIVYADNTVNAKGGEVAAMDGNLFKWGYNDAKVIKSITILRCAPATGDVWNSFDVSLSSDATKEIIVVGSLTDTAVYTYADKDASGDPVVVTTRTVYFTDNYKWVDNGGKIYAYVFKSANNSFMTQWPGNLCEYSYNNDNNEAVYSFTFLAEYDTIVFSNGNGAQTVDVALGEHNGYYLTGDNSPYGVGTWDKENGGAEPPATKTLSSITATYTGGVMTVGEDLDPDGIVVTAFYSDESSERITSGYTMSEFDKNQPGLKDIMVWYKTASTSFEVTYIVAAAWDGVITIDVSGVDWFENDGCVAYVYVWYTDATNNGWVTTDNAAAHKATRTAAFTYTFQTDTAKAIEGVIVIRGTADGSTLYNKSGDLTDNGTHNIAVSSMEDYN